MSDLTIVVAGFMLRYPLGGHTWHDLQYVLGLQRLGNRVVYVESSAWPSSCYDPSRDEMTADPRYGIRYVKDLLDTYGLGESWCYLDEDGKARGMTREQLAALCRECDLFLDIGGVNVIPEMEECRRLVLVDADPVFTQIGGHGPSIPLSRYDVLFTYGENVHRPWSTMPTGRHIWHPTRQPVVLDLWPVRAGNALAPWTTVMNWSAYGDHEYEGCVYGQKDREFEPFFTLPEEIRQPMEIALNAPVDVRERLLAGGWCLADARAATAGAATYQEYLSSSRAEFSVAKHGYVSTHCGWFSDRSAAYLASGRPVVVQETGFSHWLPTGVGVMPFSTPQEAVAGIDDVASSFARHARAARELAEEYFDARRVLADLLDRSLSRSSRRSLALNSTGVSRAEDADQGGGRANHV